jgi:hypothetical protein
VLAALVLVVAVSWLPWFGRSVRDADHGGRTLRFDASAWAASTEWTVAVALAVAAGVVWLIARSLGRLQTVAGLCTLGLGLVVHRWHSIPDRPTPRSIATVIVSNPPDGPPPDVRTLVHFDLPTSYAIHRDRLNVEQPSGAASDVRYGLYVGLVAMGVLAIMVLAALAEQRARADAEEDG